jgi:hypothetical protein
LGESLDDDLLDSAIDHTNLGQDRIRAAADLLNAEYAEACGRLAFLEDLLYQYHAEHGGMPAVSPVAAVGESSGRGGTHGSASCASADGRTALALVRNGRDRPVSGARIGTAETSGKRSQKEPSWSNRIAAVLSAEPDRFFSRSALEKLLISDQLDKDSYDTQRESMRTAAARMSRRGHVESRRGLGYRATDRIGEAMRS